MDNPEIGSKEFFEKTFEEAEAKGVVDNEAPEVEVAVDISEPAEPTKTEENPYNRKRGEGYEQVDFKTASPEDIEKRFGRMYAQNKTLEKQNREMVARMKALSELVEEDLKRKSELESSKRNDLVKKEIADLQLRGRFEEATDKMKEYLSESPAETSNSSIIEERAQKIYAEELATPEEKAAAELPEDEKNYVVDFFTNNELMKNEVVREAAKKRGLELKQIYPNASPVQIVKQIEHELDQYQKKNINRNNIAPSAVQSGNGTGTLNKSSSVQLNAEQRKVAEKMLPQLTKAEAYKKYATMVALGE